LKWLQDPVIHSLTKIWPLKFTDKKALSIGSSDRGRN